MSKEDKELIGGVVVDRFKRTQFLVRLENDAVLTATISGPIRKHYIRITLGDDVMVAVDHYDVSKGIIVFRGKKKDFLARRENKAKLF